MATKEQIKKVILDIAGDPSVGEIYNLADKWADAIVSLDSETPYKADARDGDGDGMVQDGTQFERPIRETRITKPTETR
jgi:hypothetical protein